MATQSIKQWADDPENRETLDAEVRAVVALALDDIMQEVKNRVGKRLDNTFLTDLARIVEGEISDKQYAAGNEVYA